MAMMTALGEAPSLENTPWSRARLRHASARAIKKCRQAKPRPARLKASGGRQISGSDQLGRRREVGSCLARQAGPGPRI